METTKRANRNKRVECVELGTRVIVDLVDENNYGAAAWVTRRAWDAIGRAAE